MYAISTAFKRSPNKTTYHYFIDSTSLLLIVVETENAAYESFEGAHAVLAKPTKKKLAQTATSGEFYSKPEKKKIASNAADVYSSVEKSKGKGFSAFYDV